jgi:hypothetical protein
VNSHELIVEQHRVAAEIREIKRRLGDYSNPPSFSERNDLHARIPANELRLRELQLQWREQVIAENEPIAASAAAELEEMRLEVERAYRLVANAVLFVDPGKATEQRDLARAQKDLADAHAVLGRRDDIIAKGARARAAIIESRSAA